MKVCLVGSSGGHLTHLYMLKPFWKDKDHFWVTFDKEDARSRLEGEKMYPCYYPTNRSLKALIKNTKIAWNVLHKEKPDLIISCGAAVAVPFFYIGKMMGAKLVYIEVFDRIDKPTMTGKMVYPIVDKFVVQWEEQKKVYPSVLLPGFIRSTVDHSLPVFFHLIRFHLLCLFRSGHIRLLLTFSVYCCRIPYHLDIQIALLADRTVAITHLQFYDLILFCRFY